MRYLLVSILISLSSHILLSQQKLMTPETYDEWKSISDVQISDNGQWISYELTVEDGDGQLILYNTESQQSNYFDRASEAQFSADNSFISFRISPSVDTIDSLKRAKTKDKDLPQDSLGIFHLNNAVYDKFANLDSYKMPEESAGLIAIHLKPSTEKDSTAVKDESDDNGSQLIVYNSTRNEIRQYPFVKDYSWSSKSDKLLIHHTGSDSVNTTHLDILHGNDLSLTNIYEGKAEILKMALDQKGMYACLVGTEDSIDHDVADMRITLYNIAENKLDSVDAQASGILPDAWKISHHFKPYFSENSQRLYFGINPIPELEDSTLLDKEKVKLEIWNYKDGMLYTQQNNQLKREKKRSYLMMWDLSNNAFAQLSDLEYPEAVVDDKHVSRYVVSYNDRPYQKYITQLGYAFKDVFLIDTETEELMTVADSIQGYPRMSAHERYVYWYNNHDTAWHAYNIAKDEHLQLSSSSFYDEINDRPMHPYPSGQWGWTEYDQHLLVYDHYDMWKIDPSSGEQIRLTNGREDRIRYRYISLDNELKSLPADTTVMISLFDEKDKSSGYALLDISSGKMYMLEKGPFQYSTRPYKAKDADVMVFSKQSFDLFPDLILTNGMLKDQKVISNANPQQSEYAWGTIELFQWKDPDGILTDGLLVKPPGFDPSKKYPLIVNFYERSSQRLHSHRRPYPHRSTINYSYWANKGYVIFNPDVKYKVGYPGQSCYDAVMSGVDALLKEGYVDESRMGLQGHSWGGYQIAYLLTKTNRFACAEAGAPVVNMISAYGGIRWGSGMSRIFQYEKTQSRIGATIWENPDLYIENSPVFELDKVETPVLILHNDQDGAVPWYQGIEYFVGLRRLNKPSWMLNYNNEPHWPVKRQNRLDFNKRLEQFFDHYLMDKPMPEWMYSGVPAVERETNDGFQLMPSDR